jgi:hypothetical protein
MKVLMYVQTSAVLADVVVEAKLFQENATLDLSTVAGLSCNSWHPDTDKDVLDVLKLASCTSILHLGVVSRIMELTNYQKDNLLSKLFADHKEVYGRMYQTQFVSNWTL